MKVQDEIVMLERRIVSLKLLQSQCNHDFGVPVSDPYTIKEERAIPGAYEYHGIHMHPRSTFVDAQKQRWARVCKTCGFIERTEKLTDVSPRRFEPDFGA